MTVNKVCLINPPTMDPTSSEFYFPMALLALGGVLKKHGVEAELWDFDLYAKRNIQADEKTWEKLLFAGLKSVGTRVFAISSICINFPTAIWLAKVIKEVLPDALVMLGGPQPSSVPKETLERFPFIDLIAIGEGEITLEEMIKADFARDTLEKMPGVAMRTPRGVVVNPRRNLVKNLDELPLPDYSLVRFGDYNKVRNGAFYPNIEVGRGCPFHCTFCSTAVMWEGEFRVKSPKRILEEMQALHGEFGVKAFDFIHDNFTTSRKFVLDFCDFLKTNNNEGFQWSASSRTDCIDIKRLELMHSAGMIDLFFGLESGSARMQEVMKKNLDLENFEPIIQRGNELKIDMTTSFILGFPQEDKADIDQTILRALHYKCLGTKRVHFSKLAPFAGTRVYEEAKQSLSEFSRVATASPLHFKLSFVLEAIKAHPDLFSSYYHIPHPKFSQMEMIKLIEFSNLLVNVHPLLGSLLLRRIKKSPTQLFEKWELWAGRKNIPYFDPAKYGTSRFKADFSDFIEDSFVKNKGSIANIAVKVA